ncbi:MAG: nucleoside kinase [Treponemataceae bacterium]
MICIKIGSEQKTLKKASSALEIIGDIAKIHDIENPRDIYALRVNNLICSITKPLKFDAEVKPILGNSIEGAEVYRRTLSFVLAVASHKLFPKTRLLIGHSLGHSFYYTVDGVSLSTSDITKLQNEMSALIEQNKKISYSKISYQVAITLFEELNLSETLKQLHYMCPPSITINTLDNFSDQYYGPLLPSTGYLDAFELLPFGEGFLLRFPSHHDHSTLTPFVKKPQLFSVYERYKAWGKLLNITSVASFNKVIYENTYKDFIDITETLQNKCFADAADKIKERKNVKVVLIAGPSSSGKTTSSKKIAMQLQVIGFNPKVISIDDYYIGREKTPKDENGNYDYECLGALNVELLNKDLIKLFDYQEIEIPSYDFVDGRSFYSGAENKKMKLLPNDILILEGIHGLNDKLTPLIPNEVKFKIYVSALTQLNLDDHNRISTRDNRLIRRIVRDYRTRGKSAIDTIRMWTNVQKGENLHIFPFQDNADVMINTALDYELAVLKVYAEPLLRCISPLEEEYAEASRLLLFLNNFLPIPDKHIPSQSLIREFIGNSDFEY